MQTPAVAGRPTTPTWARWRATDVVGVAAAVATGLAVLSYPLRGATLDEVFASWVVHNAPLGIVGSLGLAVALRHQPGNRAARLLFASSLLSAVHVTTLAAANWLAAADPVTTLQPEGGAVLDLAALPPVAGGLFWVSTWVWVPAASTALLHGVPLLPDGRWPSPRWRGIELVAALAAAAFTGAWALYLWPGREAVLSGAELPHGTPLIDALFLGGALGMAVCAGFAIAAVVVRLRRAQAEERARLRPVGAMALLTLATMVVLYPWQPVWAAVSAVTLSGLVLSIVLAMTRHRLFDVEVLVSRAVTAAVLAAFVTLAYVSIVTGIGWLLGARDELGLALAATAVVAVAFEPLRRRVAHWARRLVLGERATQGEVLGRLSDGLVDATSDDEVLVRVAELLVVGTGAARVEVRTRGVGNAAAGDPPGAFAGARAAEVRSDGRTLGEVVLLASRDDLLLPEDEALLGRVAALLGPVLRSSALTEQLQQSVEELRASRQRLVLAEETVRRSVERDIHDGAQQQLLGIRLRLGLAAALAERGEAERLADVLAQTAADTETAIQGLRDLARGLHPPVLEQQGLVAALRSHLRQVPLDARVEAPPDLPRPSAGVEAALHLCCLEAVQNVTKHAAASTVTVRLSHDGKALHLAVVDDGRGFVAAPAGGVGLQSIRDRVEALGGTVRVTSSPGAGTTLAIRVPLEQPAGPVARQPSPSDGSPVSAR